MIHYGIRYMLCYGRGVKLHTQDCPYRLIPACAAPIREGNTTRDWDLVTCAVCQKRVPPTDRLPAPQPVPRPSLFGPQPPQPPPS